MLEIEYKLILFAFASICIVWLSRSSLREVRSHGFYRFFAWETILVLLLMNINYWFTDPFSFRQIISWALLIVSLFFIYQGVRMFRSAGKLDNERKDSSLIGIEKTTVLVTTGVYHYIRHPFYSSLLFLGWGIFFKNIGWIGLLLALINTIFLLATAWKEETENIEYFGEEYREYMRRTKMFVPFVI